MTFFRIALLAIVSGVLEMLEALRGLDAGEGGGAEGQGSQRGCQGRARSRGTGRLRPNTKVKVAPDVVARFAASEAEALALPATARN